MDATISTMLQQHPEWRQPARHAEMARWLNEHLDDGASWVIEDVGTFVKEFNREQSLARLELPGSGEGLAGYPDLDLTAMRPPTLEAHQMVFYVQRYASRLPLKVTVSLVPPHVPAMYEPVPRLLSAEAAMSGLTLELRP